MAKYVESCPSSRSAFRLEHSVVDEHVNGAVPVAAVEINLGPCVYSLLISRAVSVIPAFVVMFVSLFNRNLNWPLSYDPVLSNPRAPLYQIDELFSFLNPMAAILLSESP